MQPPRIFNIGVRYPPQMMMASIDAHRDDEIKDAIKHVHENGSRKQACGEITRPALTDKIVMCIS